MTQARRRSDPGGWARLAAVAGFAVLTTTLLGAVSATDGSDRRHVAIRSLPADKISILERQQADLYASQVPGAKASLAVPPRNEVQRPRVAGIAEMHQGPFSALDFLADNFWQGPVGPRWLLAYAGTSRDNGRPKAAVRLYTEPVDPNVGSHLTFVGLWTAPTQDSSLRIESVNKARMILIAPITGQRLVFDLSSHRYSVPDPVT